MKVVESNNRSVTLQLSRTEFENLSKALSMAIYLLVGARTGKPIPITVAEQKTAEVFLPKIQNLFQKVTQIALQNGWLDEDEDE
jgi:hypothetical protein